MSVGVGAGGQNGLCLDESKESSKAQPCRES